MADSPVVPIRQVVSAMLYNARGQVLLQLRDDKPGIPYPNHWTLFGGQVEKGETPDQAIRRELQEELGRVVPLVLWKEFDDPDRTIPGQVLCLHYSYSGPFDVDPAALTITEGQRAAYFGPEDLEGQTLAFQQQGLLREFFDLLARNEQLP